MGLFTPIWQSKNADKVRRFIERSNDQKKLANIALHSPVAELRTAAARRVTDPEQIVRTASAAEARGDRDTAEAVTAAVTDPRLLRRLVNAVPNTALSRQPQFISRSSDLLESSLQYRLFRRIEDEDVLSEFVRDGSLYSVRALERIQSKERLLELGRAAGGGMVLHECARRTGDHGLLAREALQTTILGAWDDSYDCLLDDPEYGPAVSAHLAELKEAAEAKRQAALAEKREKDRARREENQRRKHEEFLRSPAAGLKAAEGKRTEAKLWKEWYEYALARRTVDLFHTLTHEMKDLSWAKHFPAGAVNEVFTDIQGERYIDGDSYFTGDTFDEKAALDDLRRALTALYVGREDLRGEILALDGELFYSGRKAGAVDFGDHHESWLVSYEALPALRMSVKATESGLLDVFVKQVPTQR